MDGVEAGLYGDGVQWQMGFATAVFVCSGGGDFGGDGLAVVAG